MSRSNHTIHLPAEFLYDPNITPVQFKVYAAIKSRQGSNDYCYAFQKTVADDISMPKSNFCRAVKDLIRHGWIEKKGRHLRCLDEKKVITMITNNTKKGDEKVITMITEVITMITEVIPMITSTQKPHLKTTLKNHTLSAGISDKEKMKAEKPPPSWCADDWQLQYAETFAERLAEADCLDKGIMRKTNSDRAKVMQNWADVFDKIHRLDGYPIKEISSLLSWLFQKGNWWIETKNIRTATKLRKTNSDGERYFDIMIRRMEAKHQRRENMFDSFSAIPTYGGVT